MQVASSSIVLMVMGIIVGLLIPIVVSIYLKRKYQAKFYTFFES